MLTPDERNYALWRINVWRFMLQTRLVSENAIVRYNAIQHASEAHTLQSVLDTPPERYTPHQQAWSSWIAAACRLYHEAHRDADYTRQADLLREKRDNALERMTCTHP